MAEDGSIFKYEEFTVLHAHEGKTYYIEAHDAVLHELFVVLAEGMYHIARVPQLLHLFGHSIIREPKEGIEGKFFHEGSLNFAFRNPIRE